MFVVSRRLLRSASFLIEFSILRVRFGVQCIFIYDLFFFASFIYRSCIIGPELTIKVCSIGTVINRIAYAADYCQLEGTSGRQTQPMPIRWMAWESVLLVSKCIWNVFEMNLAYLYTIVVFLFESSSTCTLRTLRQCQIWFHVEYNRIGHQLIWANVCFIAIFLKTDLSDKDLLVLKLRFVGKIGV